MLVLGGVGQALPAGPTTICTIAFKILPNAAPGTTALQPGDVVCAATQGGTVTCQSNMGTVRIEGEPLTLLALQPSEQPIIEFQLRTGPGIPGVDDIVGHDYRTARARSPLAAFRGQPPLRVTTLIASRASGRRLAAHLGDPHSPEAQLQQVMLAVFEDVESRDKALELLRSDRWVDFAIGWKSYPDPGATARLAPKRSVVAVASKSQSAPPPLAHHNMLGLGPAWEFTPGWGLVGVIDGGIDPDHLALRSFTGPLSVGGQFVPTGNFLPSLSKNLASLVNGQSETEVREWQPQPVTPTTANCDDDADGYLSDPYPGHGTHVSGLVAARSVNANPVRGVCESCGLAFVRIGVVECFYSASQEQYLTRQQMEPSLVTAGIESAMHSGSQTINFSGGSINWCTSKACGLAVDLIKQRDIVFVASSGNDISFVNWPAREPNVVSAGGVDATGQMWDFTLQGCPNPSVTTPQGHTLWPECGSNYHVFGTAHRQELVAPATDVWSIFPPGWDWNPDRGCGDSIGAIGTGVDGYGPCTGTSMSAPLISGLFGLLRSINPLMPAGDPFQPSSNPYTREPALPDPFGVNAYGVRDLVAQNTGQASYDPKTGLGIPNAGASVLKMLGESREDAVVNRVTPLFSLYSSERNDYATVSTPQLAMALAYDHDEAYRMVQQGGDDFIEGEVIPGYAHLPNAHARDYPAENAARAIAMVLTTARSPDPRYPPLIPLFLMERRSSSSTPGLHDFVLLASESQVELAAALNYSYLGRQGYIYSFCQTTECSPPPGTQVLHLRCIVSAQSPDCAVFLHHRQGEFLAKGYTALFPGATQSELGYAYGLEDADNDGLVDAMERIIGTSLAHVNSDGDELTDAQEYPLHTAPFSDPCKGPVVVCTRLPPKVFRNGFE